MDISIHFNDQPCFVTVKVNDEARNDLLSPEMDSQLIRTQFLSENLLGGSHIAAQFFCALKFFFCDGLTWDDVFDWHGGIVMQNRETPLPSPLKGRS